MKAKRAFEYLLQEWGELTYHDNVDYPIIFISESESMSFTKDGRLHIYDKYPRLSLTEWNPFECTGKFTPIDSEPEPQIGDEVWAWDDENRVNYGKYEEQSGFNFYPYMVGGISYKHISLTPPQWLMEKINKTND